MGEGTNLLFLVHIFQIYLILIDLFISTIVLFWFLQQKLLVYICVFIWNFEGRCANGSDNFFQQNTLRSLWSTHSAHFVQALSKSLSPRLVLMPASQAKGTPKDVYFLNISSTFETNSLLVTCGFCVSLFTFCQNFTSLDISGNELLQEIENVVPSLRQKCHLNKNELFSNILAQNSCPINMVIFALRSWNFHIFVYVCTFFDIVCCCKFEFIFWYSNEIPWDLAKWPNSSKYP